MPSASYRDPCSFSNLSFYKLAHVSLKWTVDFDQKVIRGSCGLQFELNASSDDQFITLDTRDLLIKSVIEETTKKTLKFELGDVHPAFGSPLKISLHDLEIKHSLKLVIEYETGSGATALQWIDAQATLGKRHPYLFSQCQMIHARSIVPVQDTPMVKFTYDATVTVPKPLQALMSALAKPAETTDTSSVYHFEQKIKIPSYLLAIVVGDLVSKQVGPRTKVWSEKEMVDAAAYEFEQVEDMLKEAEDLLGKYVWGAYDLLVLPPSFPFGGMENPCLTFVTPTLIAKDKSLVSVIQHEITHSWTGNLVTNCSWEHFWLNEGFTKFIERKLVAISNKSQLYRQFECIDGWRSLKEEVKQFGEEHEFTKMVPNLTNSDPDDAFSTIPYEKGHMLLYYLEEKLGGPEIFDQYLKAHIDKFKGLSIDTDDWKKYLYEYFSDKKDILDQVDWETWLYKPGMPPVTLSFDQTLANQVKELSDRFASDNLTEVDPVFSKFQSGLKRELLSQLLDKDPLSHEKMEQLDRFCEFGSTENSEILFRWLRLGIKAKWTPIIPRALKFVCDQGRMKFTRPIYRDLYNWEEARDRTVENFKEQRFCMHQTTASLVAKDLGIFC